MSKTLELATELMQQASITPHDAGCQKIIRNYLERLGFDCEEMNVGEVSNLWARKGNKGPLLVFAGHTDVVPPGALDEWTSHPFEPVVRNNELYGRGAQDMKAAIAAMLVATEEFTRQHKIFEGSIAFLITSDEEGDADDGTQKVIDKLMIRGEKIDYCLIGEASSDKKLGDRIRNGRRGSLHGRATIQGKQGHIANPQMAINPIHLALPAFDELAKLSWDEGVADFPATTFQISNIHAGTGVKNMTPSECIIDFNLRFSPAITAKKIQARTEEIMQKHELPVNIQWKLGGEPFHSPNGELSKVCQSVIKQQLHIDSRTSTGGGTSDGRFIAKTGAEVIELGFCNNTAHQVDESVPCEDIDRLKNLYLGILNKLFNLT